MLKGTPPPVVTNISYIGFITETVHHFVWEEEGVIQKFRVGVILCSVLPNDKLVAYKIENIIPNLPSDKQQAPLQAKMPSGQEESFLTFTFLLYFPLRKY